MNSTNTDAYKDITIVIPTETKIGNIIDMMRDNDLNKAIGYWGSAVWVTDTELEVLERIEGDSVQIEHNLQPNDFIRGLKKVAWLSPTYFADFCAGDYHHDLVDLVIQCALFGSFRYC